MPPESSDGRHRSHPVDNIKSKAARVSETSSPRRPAREDEQSCANQQSRSPVRASASSSRHDNSTHEKKQSRNKQRSQHEGYHTGPSGGAASCSSETPEARANIKESSSSVEGKQKEQNSQDEYTLDQAIEQVMAKATKQVKKITEQVRKEEREQALKFAWRLVRNAIEYPDKYEMPREVRHLLPDPKSKDVQALYRAKAHIEHKKVLDPVDPERLTDNKENKQAQSTAEMRTGCSSGTGAEDEPLTALPEPPRRRQLVSLAETKQMAAVSEGQEDADVSKSKESTLPRSGVTKQGRSHGKRQLERTPSENSLELVQLSEEGEEGDARRPSGLGGEEQSRQTRQYKTRPRKKTRNNTDPDSDSDAAGRQRSADLGTDMYTSERPLRGGTGTASATLHHANDDPLDEGEDMFVTPSPSADGGASSYPGDGSAGEGTTESEQDEPETPSDGSDASYVPSEGSPHLESTSEDELARPGQPFVHKIISRPRPAPLLPRYQPRPMKQKTDSGERPWIRDPPNTAAAIPDKTKIDRYAFFRNMTHRDNY